MDPEAFWDVRDHFVGQVQGFVSFFPPPKVGEAFDSITKIIVILPWRLGNWLHQRPLYIYITISISIYIYIYVVGTATNQTQKGKGFL